MRDALSFAMPFNRAFFKIPRGSKSAAPRRLTVAKFHDRYGRQATLHDHAFSKLAPLIRVQTNWFAVERAMCFRLALSRFDRYSALAPVFRDASITSSANTRDSRAQATGDAPCEILSLSDRKRT
jgi:hypothetical protein